MNKINIENLYFDEPRLKLIHFSRFLTRLISYSLYSVLIVSAITFLLSEVDNLFWLGILISLFLGDRLIHFGEAERSIVGLSRYLPRLSRRKDFLISDKFNAADFLTPASLSIIERAFDRAVIIAEIFIYI